VRGETAEQDQHQTQAEQSVVNVQMMAGAGACRRCNFTH
jgi:hypothetical protein